MQESFYPANYFRRQDEDDDHIFYQVPRLGWYT